MPGELVAAVPTRDAATQCSMHLQLQVCMCIDICFHIIYINSYIRIHICMYIYIHTLYYAHT